MKKLLSLFLSLTMMLSITFGISTFSYADTYGSFGYTPNQSTMEAQIYSYYGSEENVVIPSEMNGYTVTGISRDAFSSNSSIKSIYIPATVNDIYSNSITACISLESITVDENNQYYSSQDGVLFNKEKSVLMTYPAGKTDVSYNVPDTVWKVEEYAFDYSQYLKNVTIPASVMWINYSFNMAEALERFDVAGDNQNYSSIDGILFNKDKTQLLQCPRESKVVSFEIPHGVQTIDRNAFYYCKNLSDIGIPDTVTYISSYAFAHCYALKAVTVPASVDFIDPYAFMSCTSMTSAVIEDGVIQIGKGAFYNCSRLTEMAIPASVTYISNLAFANCSSLRCVTVLNPNCDFAVCKNLIPPNSAVRGWENSTAQTYAETYGRTFSVIEKYTVNALGGSIRVTDAGLRFGFSFDKTQSVNPEEYGFVYMYSQADNFTADTVGVKKLTANNKLDNGDNVTFNLVFTNIPKSAYDQIVSARAYVKIDGNYYYSDTLQYSFSSVANAVLADSEIGQDIKDRIINILQ